MICIESYKELMNQMRYCARKGGFNEQIYVGIKTNPLSQKLQDKLNANIAVVASHDRVGIRLNVIRELMDNGEKFWLRY